MSKKRYTPEQIIWGSYSQGGGRQGPKSGRRRPAGMKEPNGRLNRYQSNSRFRTSPGFQFKDIAKSYGKYEAGEIMGKGITLAPRQFSFSRHETQSIEFKEPSWVVSGPLPEGLCLLLARPQKGKTCFALNVSVGAIDRRFSEISCLDLETYRNRRKATPTRAGKPRADATVNRELSTLRHRLNNLPSGKEMVNIGLESKKASTLAIASLL